MAIESAPGGARGDDAFADLTAPYLAELRLHCYRMVGTLADADDLVQETLLAAWRGLDAFAGRASLRTWLYRIATNRCLNAIRDARRRPPTELVPPFTPPEPSRRGDVTWVQPYPCALLPADGTHGPESQLERREDIELAFVVALQRLPPRQTAVVVLVDVLDFALAEVAAMIDSTPTAVKGLLQRGRATLARHHDGAAHVPAGGAASSSELALARRFAEAFGAGDVPAVVALLTDDAVLAMPPAPHEYVGAAAIAGFLRASVGAREGEKVRLEPTCANGQPAFVCSSVVSGVGSADSVIVLTMSGSRISRVTRVLDPGLAPWFATADGAT